jgi:hypothetical protein
MSTGEIGMILRDDSILRLNVITFIGGIEGSKLPLGIQGRGLLEDESSSLI